VFLVDLLAVLFCKTVFGIIRVLPRPLGLLITKLLVRLILLFIPRAKFVALRNLELCFPERPRAEHLAIYERSLKILAENLLFFARIPSVTKESLEQSFDYDAALPIFSRLHQENERGILIVTAHFGYFEGLVQAQALLVKPLAVLVRAFDLPKLDAWWNARREHHGGVVFGRKGGYKQLVRFLNEGTDVAILADQNVKKNHAVFTPFFGHQVATTKTVALAALETDAPVVVGLAPPIGKGRSAGKLYLLPRITSLPGSREEKMVSFTSKMNAILEQEIRACPEAWFWIHRRFKTRPPGEAESLYDGANASRSSVNSSTM